MEQWRAYHMAVFMLTASAGLVMGVAASSAPASAAPAPVTECSVTIDGADLVVSWPAAPGADSYVVYRSVNDSSDYWRGVSTGTSFIDSNRSGVTIVYRVVTKTDGVKSAPTTCNSDTAPPISAADAIVVGDMASCGADGADAVAGLLDQIAGPIWGVGDYVYPDGTPAEYQDCFDPKLGRHRDRFHPVAGNHEYFTAGAAGYFGYFGAAAGDPATGYYAETIANWRVLFLNSNCGEVGGCSVGDPQYLWAEQQLVDVAPNECLAVVWHHPRWSSWGPYGAQDNLDPLVRLLSGHGLDLLLTGHAHQYERLTQLSPDYVPDPVNGFRQFTVGTGGATLRSPNANDVLAESAALIIDNHGVLALHLEVDSFGWQFIDVSGSERDAGTAGCDNA